MDGNGEGTLFHLKVYFIILHHPILHSNHFIFWNVSGSMILEDLWVYDYLFVTAAVFVMCFGPLTLRGWTEWWPFNAFLAWHPEIRVQLAGFKRENSGWCWLLGTFFLGLFFCGAGLGGGGRLISHYIWGSIRNAWRKPREIHLVLAQGLNNLRSTDVCQRQRMCVKAGEAFLEEIWDPFENLDPGILYLTRILGALHKRCPIWRCQKAKIIKIDPWRCFPFSKILASLLCHWMGKVILPQRVVPSLVWMTT